MRGHMISVMTVRAVELGGQLALPQGAEGAKNREVACWPAEDMGVAKLRGRVTPA
jgi:hypothetical protein